MPANKCVSVKIEAPVLVLFLKADKAPRIQIMRTVVALFALNSHFERENCTSQVACKCPVKAEDKRDHLVRGEGGDLRSHDHFQLVTKT